MTECRYYFDNDGRFSIDSYNTARPFSSFLPGVAGLKGIPLWVFYVNRGQGIASFGVRDKDGAIMEFYPANKSYQFVPTAGFRTFIKLRDTGRFYEPFSLASAEKNTVECMHISPDSLELTSSDDITGLTVSVNYFTIPNENFAGLVRRVKILNTSSNRYDLEIMDGLSAILPSGVGNFVYKELGNTIKAWMDVYGTDSKIPYYRLRASTDDTAQVNEITEGHFIGAFSVIGNTETLLQPVVDADLIFGKNTSLITPDGFIANGLDAILSSNQITANKVPCGFAGIRVDLDPGKSVELDMVIGHTDNIESIRQRQGEIFSEDYLNVKARESKELVCGLTSCVATKTSNSIFDAYCLQNYLDNMLRGGHPVTLEAGEKRFVYHVYSRKHGDLERDYNFFTLQPSYYSQGNGNFRDADQNRRNDIFINPKVGDYDIRMFMSLIQPDGYNPLVVKGCSFKVTDIAAVLKMVGEADRKRVKEFLQKTYTPGELLTFIERHGISVGMTPDAFLAYTLSLSEQRFEADFGEGYWIDHWTYNLDLIEAYLAIYPDRLNELLFDTRDYLYYDSPAIVLPRDEKYVLSDGKVRQYASVAEDEGKVEHIKARDDWKNWVRTGSGKGEVYKANLYSKLLALVLIKFATLDPEGLGIEMEANKPGWNDSLNGLPGLFSSGFGETMELLRIVNFLNENTTGTDMIKLPIEQGELLKGLDKLLDNYADLQTESNRRYDYWNTSASLREGYREKVKYGFDGDETEVSMIEVASVLGKIKFKLEDARKRALAIGGGIFPMYFNYEVMNYELLTDESGGQRYNSKGLPLVRVKEFRRIDLPHFLEGSVRALKVMDDIQDKRNLYTHIKSSELYDKELGMYKVNESLQGQSLELGRSRAFTPGWLENESVFLHMEYKYLLELLKGGLYDEFFDDISTALVPFMDPERYGRSILENSSFIASSANPDPSVHGVGFVARLSGSTAEFISMWVIMMAGERPFRISDGELQLTLKPTLPKWLFDDNACVTFRFLGSTEVVYLNPERGDTYGSDGVSPVRYVLTASDGSIVSIDSSAVGNGYAEMVRDGLIDRIEVMLSR